MSELSDKIRNVALSFGVAGAAAVLYGPCTYGNYSRPNRTFEQAIKEPAETAWYGFISPTLDGVGPTERQNVGGVGMGLLEIGALAALGYGVFKLATHKEPHPGTPPTPPTTP